MQYYISYSIVGTGQFQDVQTYFEIPNICIELLNTQLDSKVSVFLYGHTPDPRTSMFVKSYHFGLVVTPVLLSRNSVALRRARYDIRSMLWLGKGKQQEEVSCDPCIC